MKNPCLFHNSMNCVLRWELHERGAVSLGERDDQTGRQHKSWPTFAAPDQEPTFIGQIEEVAPQFDLFHATNTQYASFCSFSKSEMADILLQVLESWFRWTPICNHLTEKSCENGTLKTSLEREREGGGQRWLKKLLETADKAFLTQSAVQENPDCFHIPQKFLSPFNPRSLKD